MILIVLLCINVNNYEIYKVINQLIILIYAEMIIVPLMYLLISIVRIGS